MNKEQLKLANLLSNWKWLTVVSTALLCLIAWAPSAFADDDEPEEKMTIKQIMVKAHKPVKETETIYLLKKVATGKASDEEATQLHDLYTKLAALTPPKGEKADWTTKTTALVAAAKSAVDKEEGFKAKLRRASDCTACHDAHKK